MKQGAHSAAEPHCVLLKQTPILESLDPRSYPNIPLNFVVACRVRQKEAAGSMMARPCSSRMLIVSCHWLVVPDADFAFSPFV